MDDILAVAKLKRFAHVCAEVYYFFFAQLSFHQPVEKRRQQFHSYQNVVSYPVLMRDDLVVLIADYVAVALELSHDLILIDDLPEDIIIVSRDRIHVRALCQPGLNIILILRYGNYLERGPVDSAEFFSCYFEYLAETPLAEKPAQIP